jgi:hypothetical protein
MHYSINPADIKTEIEKLRHTVTNTVSSTETSVSKAIDDASLQRIYKLSHSWVTVTATATMNNPRRSGFRFQVQRHLKPAFFTVLHTCRTAIMLINHPFCDGGG